MVAIIQAAPMIWNAAWNSTKTEKEQTIQKSICRFKLVYFEEFQRIDEAFYREKQVQGWSRKKKEALIKSAAVERSRNPAQPPVDPTEELHKLSECTNESHFKNYIPSENVPFGSDGNVPFGSAQGTDRQRTGEQGTDGSDGNVPFGSAQGTDRQRTGEQGTDGSDGNVPFGSAQGTDRQRTGEQGTDGSDGNVPFGSAQGTG